MDSETRPVHTLFQLYGHGVVWHWQKPMLLDSYMIVMCARVVVHCRSCRLGWGSTLRTQASLTYAMSVPDDLAAHSWVRVAGCAMKCLVRKHGTHAINTRKCSTITFRMICNTLP